MTVAYKVLGQSSPAVTTLTTLYAVPVAMQAVCSSLVVCNTTANTVLYRIAVRPAGAALAAQHYLFYDVAIGPNATAVISMGLTLGATDVVSVYTGTAGLSFSLFGQEIS